MTCPTCDGTGMVSNCPQPGWCHVHLCDGGVECPDCTDPALPAEPEETG